MKARLQGMALEKKRKKEKHPESKEWAEKHCLYSNGKFSYGNSDV